MTTDEDVRRALKAQGLPVRACGLNADWNVQAWHLGPSDTPNMNDGDLYLLDNESDAGTFSVVRRSYNDGENDEIEPLCENLPLRQAVELAALHLK